jgi:predicted dehydrogenase
MGVRSRGLDHARLFTRLPNVEVVTLCDPDERFLTKAASEIEKISGKRPRFERDLRHVLDDKEIDAISIAAPNHWHALATVWACQAGKDVYVEKPISHNISEGRRMVEAARKYNRIVQVGTQNRSRAIMRAAMDYLHSGAFGDVYMIRCLVFRPRENIGRGLITAPPPAFDYDLWLGPAPFRPYQDNRVHYNWHWFWDTGNGETGNNGPHYADLARWALQEYEHPIRIQSMGSFDVYDSDQETPNNQTTMLEYADGVRIQLEVRGVYTNAEAETRIGVLLYTSKGWMRLRWNGWESYFGGETEITGEGLVHKSNLAKHMTAEMFSPEENDQIAHFSNFVDRVRDRRRDLLNADILEGHLSTAMCHLGNIAYRTRRQVVFDDSSETFPGDDEANTYLTRRYRVPFVVPEAV